MATRRGFLGFLASSPLAVKEAAEKAAAALANIKLSGVGQNGNDIGIPSSSGSDDIVRAGDYVRSFGLPSFAERGIRESVQHVYSLDPDIAIKRSWSLSVKIQEQRQRNFAIEVERIKNGGQFGLAKKGFKAISGYEWPWWH